MMTEQLTSIAELSSIESGLNFILLEKQEIPGKTVTKYRFHAYDLTTFDSDNPTEPGIWERGMNEADHDTVSSQFQLRRMS